MSANLSRVGERVSLYEYVWNALDTGMKGWPYMESMEGVLPRITMRMLPRGSHILSFHWLLVVELINPVENLTTQHSPSKQRLSYTFSLFYDRSLSPTYNILPPTTCVVKTSATVPTLSFQSQLFSQQSITSSQFSFLLS